MLILGASAIVWAYECPSRFLSIGTTLTFLFYNFSCNYKAYYSYYISLNVARHKAQPSELNCSNLAFDDEFYFSLICRFLTCARRLTHVIAIGWTSVRPSVCLSVTRWYCVKTAQPIVKLSSLPGSPMILVF